MGSFYIEIIRYYTLFIVYKFHMLTYSKLNTFVDKKGRSQLIKGVRVVD